MLPNYSRPAFDPKTTEALQKPARGTGKLARISRAKAADAREEAQKQKARKRDGHCRWPHLTPEAKELCAREVRHVAHLTHKGMGGDKDTIRSRHELMIAVCAPVHMGPGSLHAGDKRVLFLTAEKTNGPVAFLQKRGTKWVEIARELWPGMLAKAADR